MVSTGQRWAQHGQRTGWYQPECVPQELIQIKADCSVRGQTCSEPPWRELPCNQQLL